MTEQRLLLRVELWRNSLERILAASKRPDPALVQLLAKINATLDEARSRVKQTPDYKEPTDAET